MKEFKEILEVLSQFDDDFHREACKLLLDYKKENSELKQKTEDLQLSLIAALETKDMNNANVGNLQKEGEGKTRSNN